MYLATYPFELVGVDVMGPLPVSHKGNRYLIIFTDHFSKYAIMLPAADQESSTLAELLIKHVVCQHGTPAKLLTDRGQNFLSNLSTKVYELLKIKKVNTTAYHPQTDGLNERINKTACDMLSMYVSPTQQNWDEFLPYIQFAYNTSTHAATKVSPFKILFGRDAVIPSDHQLKSINIDKDNISDTDTYIADLTNKLQTIHENARYYNEKIVQTQEATINSNRKPPKSYPKDSLVQLYIPTHKEGLSNKLAHNWFGPYLVSKVISPLNVELTHPSTKEKQVVHINRLKTYHQDQSAPFPQDPTEHI